MTAATRPRLATAVRQLETPEPPPPADQRGPELRALTTVALAALTGAAAIGLGRLFRDASFLGPVLIAVIASHAISAVCRTLRLPLWLSLLVSAAGLAAVAVWVVEPHTTASGVPTGDTWHAISHDLSDAWQKFGEVVAPTPVTRGFVLAAVAGAWSAALISDVAAFRLGAPFEATIPSFTMFIFGAVLGADRHRVGYATAYLGALLVFLLLLGAVRRSERLTWFAGRSRGGPTAIAQGGVILVVIALAGALGLGPRLPGAKSEAVVDWRPQRDNGPSSRQTVSPLVDIRARLVDQSEVEVFTVESGAPAYWRLTALDKFDGQIWSSVGTYRPAKSKLPQAEPLQATERRTLQRFSVQALSSIWLPAAYRPVGISDVSRVRFDDETASLLTESATSDGLQYKVTSEVPVLTADQLAPVRSVAPASIARRYLTLPPNFPDRVTALAQTITGLDKARCARPRCTPAELGAQSLSPYQRARALQDWMRSSLSYDLRVPPGHDDAAIERFLFVTKRGYCEQFAGTYAAMARAVGLPARVAVGFTTGDVIGTASYRVRGKHAHAWPEVYLEGFGWVAFEPTPGRGQPGTEGYTGVAAQALTTEGGTTPTTAPSTAPTVAPPPTTPAPEAPKPEAVKHHSPWPGRLLRFVVLPLLVLGALVASIPMLRSWRRQRRRAQARSPLARVLLSWDEAGEDLALAGRTRRPWETTTEYAARAADVAPGAGDALAQLAQDTSTAAFSREAIATEVAVRAEGAAAAVRADLRDRATRRERLWWAVDPRPLWSGRQRVP